MENTSTDIGYNMIHALLYDLLHIHCKLNEMACDEAYEYCKKVYSDFLKSEYNNSYSRKSEYDCLQEYILEVRNKTREINNV